MKKKVAMYIDTEVWKDIRIKALKKGMSVGEYLTFLHGSPKAKTTEIKVAIPKKIEKAREVFSEIEKKAGVKPVTLFTGGYSKESQVGKK